MARAHAGNPGDRTAEPVRDARGGQSKLSERHVPPDGEFNPPIVEIGDLAVYDALLGNTDIAASLPTRGPEGAERLPRAATTAESPALAGVTP